VSKTWQPVYFLSGSSPNFVCSHLTVKIAHDYATPKRYIKHILNIQIPTETVKIAHDYATPKRNRKHILNIQIPTEHSQAMSPRPELRTTDMSDFYFYNPSMEANEANQPSAIMKDDVGVPKQIVVILGPGGCFNHQVGHEQFHRLLRSHH
jgi:hypothetical protein